VRLLTEFGVDRGLSARACLAGSGVRQQDLADPVASVSRSQELAVVRNLLSHFGSEPALGAQAGTRYHFTSLGILGLALASSSTCRSALDFAMRHFDLTFALSRFELSDVKSETWITFDESALPDDVRRFVIERDASILVTMRRDLMPEHRSLNSVHFSFPAPQNVERYEKAFGVRPSFNNALNQLRSSKSMLVEPLPQANAFTFKAAEEECRRLVERRRSAANLSDRVLERLIRGGIREMTEIAADLCMTPRTLRRRLRDEGTTFIELRDELRLSMAEDMLARREPAIEEIACRLGFSSSTLFINAFKKWRGATPLAYRKKMAALRES
jgi:AraC-like DNA-binding protein